ncbi:sugar ABC transporter substrate-binding protein [Spirochaeta cellobiosiphila]|uniref:sugar ABC transporter substrate-binding protein n=1 Tax=Spirochaeta cellobiosiphila TaxID=504483 RepID=UPI00048BDC0D|nr:substrate-binding domain-containing protein [Spirochaeta cellobiosiphila]
MKKILFFFIFILVLIIGAGLCYSLWSESHPTNHHISFIRMKEGGLFWSDMRNGAREARSDTGSIVDFYSTADASDVTGQINYIYEAINKGTECIVITPGTYYLLKKPLEEAERAGIKVISIYNEFDKGKGSSTSFYMTDLEPAGAAMAQEVLRQYHFSYINAIILGSFDTVTSEQYMARGFTKIIKKVPGVEFRVVWAGRNIDSIYNQIKGNFRLNKSINLFFALNDETSEALVRFMKDNQPDHKILTIGSGNSLMNIEAIETEIMDYSLVINSFAIGYQSINMAVKLLNKQKISPLGIDYTIVNKKNMFDPEVQKRLFVMP